MTPCGSLEESHNNCKTKKGEHYKTTETQRSQRKSANFYEKKETVGLS